MIDNRQTEIPTTSNTQSRMVIHKMVGIDGIEIWSGKLQLDLAETFAPKNGDEPGKYTEGLGLRYSSFPDGNEDIVTMGANAAKRLMDRKGLSPDDIGRIDVATESSFDNSKPVSTYIAGCLEQVYSGDFHHANKGERKFACIAGTQALDDACNWIRADRHRGRSALVIATDTALYSRGDPGEATQGAGAIALLVSEDPSVTELSSAQGHGSADETDFLKPNQQFPSVDGKRSIHVYLARMREALQDYQRVVGDMSATEFARVPFHTPFPGMVNKAALLGYRHLIRDTELEAKLDDTIGRQPRRSEFDNNEEFEDAIRTYTEGLEGTEQYNNWFEQTISPTLSLSEQVGNWYTGSVHLARASALKRAAESGVDLSGEKFLVASYGSGAQAEIHHEQVQDGWKNEVKELNIDEQLIERYDLSYEEYERVHDIHNHDMHTERDVFTESTGEFVFTGWGDMEERQYEFVQ